MLHESHTGTSSKNAQVHVRPAIHGFRRIDEIKKSMLLRGVGLGSELTCTAQRAQIITLDWSQLMMVLSHPT